MRARIVAVGAPNPVVVVDGRSGAGKSSLVRRLVADWPGRGRVQSVALDDVYPGWDGLDAGVAYAREMILSPHARGLHGVWERWDWERSERVEAHAVDPSLPLVVEGAGLLTPEVSRLADVSVWVEAPATSRRTRALARDGDTYRPHWDRWARQEEAHIAAHSPAERADVVVRIP